VERNRLAYRTEEAAGDVTKKAKTQCNDNSNSNSNSKVILRKCKECLQEKCKSEYSKNQWKWSTPGEGKCKVCTQTHLLARAGLSLPPTLICVTCKKVKGNMSEFSKKEREQGIHDKCINCIEFDGTLTCVSCNRIKGKARFDPQQRKKEGQVKCASCCDKELQERLERYRAMAQAEHDQKQRLCRKQLDANGPQIKMPTFQNPDSGSPFNNFQDESSHVQFESSPIVSPTESLIGEYDLIFYYTKDDESCWLNRATMGSLRFEMYGDGKIHGSLSVNRAVRDDMYFHIGEEVRIGPNFTVSNIEDIINFDELCDVHVIIKRVAKRHAIKYMPEADGPGEDLPSHWRNYFDSIQFETPEAGGTGDFGAIS